MDERKLNFLMDIENKIETLHGNQAASWVKNRFYKLYSKELSLKKIEDKISSLIKERTGENLPSNFDDDRHKPREVAKFLRLFATSDLKYLTHGYDKPNSAFEREKILKNALDVFEKEKRNYVIPAGLFRRIETFIKGKSGESTAWFFNGNPYPLSWSSKEVTEWCKKNPYTHPLNFEKFAKEGIYPFKQSIEIKAPQLELLIKEKAKAILAETYRDFHISYHNIDKPSFYNDIDKLLSGIAGIFESIKEQFYLNPKNNQITISFEKKVRGLRILKIIHENSECNKELNMNLLKGSLLGTKKAFFQNCDWTIQTKNISKFNTLNVWAASIETPRLENKEIEIKGFTHIIKIYAF